MEHTKRVIKSLEIAANENKDNFSETMIVGTKSILAITEAFRLMGRRAEAEVQRLNATAQPVSDGWVKCSERMPVDGKEVLCAYKGLGQGVHIWHGQHWDEGDFDSSIFGKLITHWMPLPAAPGGQDD